MYDLYPSLKLGEGKINEAKCYPGFQENINPEAFEADLNFRIENKQKIAE